MNRILKIGMDVHSTNYTLCIVEPKLEGDPDRLYEIQVEPDYLNKEHGMDLSKYDRKHVRITDKWGETFVGLLLRWNHEIKLKNSEFR